MDLREAANMLQLALNATNVQQEESGWTAVIEKYERLDRAWVPDVVGRAYGNRGNARSRQGKFEAAIADYNRAHELCPWSADPVLNRGVALENLQRYADAARDYRTVLAAYPNDVSAWNNLGNTQAGLGDWVEAERCFRKAAQLAPNFSFAAGNAAVALYQNGDEEAALRQFRALLRRFPDGFDDMRAALTAGLWAIGKEGAAAEQWDRMEDLRYKDISWVRNKRHWPPKLAQALDNFIKLKSMGNS